MPVIVSGGAATSNSIIVADEGSTIGTATVLNFTGAGGTASFSGGTATVNISGGTAASGEFTEIGQVKRTSGDISTSSTTFVDATGLSVTMTTAAVRCIVHFTGSALGAVGESINVDLNIDGTRVGGTYGLTVQEGASTGDVSFTYVTDVLTAASHTFKIQIRSATGSSVKLWATSAVCPAILQVLETSMAS